MARPPLDERLHHVRVPVGAGEVQRGVAVSILVVGIDSAREDGLDIIYLAVSVKGNGRGAPKMQYSSRLGSRNTGLGWVSSWKRVGSTLTSV